MLNPFTPGGTVTLPVTAASARVALPNPTDRSRTVMITEALGLEIAFIAFGDSTVTAVVPTGSTPVSGYAVLGGSKEPLSIGAGVTHVAAITSSGTATLYITTGDGF